ncbi:hypothetical protein LGR54_09450 [Ancylobacter sp. Lp-2]|uniref:hypothetical protein n=1 Tax=Ancylobacter sp. Lp-2 TaxID=2881339 RepID=UPI001E3F77E1|nr:hypothetical protein [Ancylobacter sp. Lp-2]MCB4768827.1 hypothetical protein [Ancylobacter sp. Lp-2]
MPNPRLSLDVVEVLAQLACEGTIVLIATHDLRLAAHGAQEAALVYAGEVMETGAAAQLFGRPQRECTARCLPAPGYGVCPVEACLGRNLRAGGAFDA